MTIYVGRAPSANTLPLLQSDDPEAMMRMTTLVERTFTGAFPEVSYQELRNRVKRQLFFATVVLIGMGDILFAVKELPEGNHVLDQTNGYSQPDGLKVYRVSFAAVGVIALIVGTYLSARLQNQEIDQRSERTMTIYLFTCLLLQVAPAAFYVKAL